MAGLKPLPAAPLTDADWVIWCLRYRSMDVGSYPGPWLRIQADDRRDAALMSWLSVFRERHYAAPCDIPLEYRLSIVHLMCRIDPQWPAGHYGLDLT